MNKQPLPQKTISLFFLALALVALSIGGCKTTKKLPLREPEPVKAEQLTAESFLSQSIDYTTFSGKVAMHLEQNGQSQDFTTQVRMKKDQNIWASIVAAGLLEVARAYVTPDSLRAMVRVGKKHYALAYQDGMDLVQANIDFPILQDLFIGNPFFVSGPIKSFVVLDTTVVIAMEKDGFQLELTYDKNQRILTRQNLMAPERDFSFNVQYGKYAGITLLQPFAFSRQVTIRNKGKVILLDMDFSKADLNVPVETEYSVPASYQKIEIPFKK